MVPGQRFAAGADDLARDPWLIRGPFDRGPQVKDRVDEIFRRLSGIARARQKLKEFHSVSQSLLSQVS